MPQITHKVPTANQKLSMIQGERDGNSLLVQNQRKNINKDIEDRNNIIIGCLLKIYIWNTTLTLKIKNIFFKSAHEKFTNIANMLGDKENIIKLHKVETLQTTHTDQNAIKLELKSAIKNKKRLPT